MTMAFTNSIEKPTVQNKAIVVDNNIINAHYLKKMLTDEGLEINVISDASQLLKLIDQPSVKIVFLDSETLGIQFKEVVNYVQEYCALNNKDITIVGTTPYSLEGARKQLIKMGVQHALSTPIYKKHISEIINSGTYA